jgi:hypothetical protein
MGPTTQISSTRSQGKDLFNALSWSPNHFGSLYLMLMAVLVLVAVAAIIPIRPG